MKDLIERNNSTTRGKQVVGVPRNVTHVGRNDACPCGSGKKYKKCCGKLNDFEKFNIQEKAREDEERRQSEAIKKYLVSEHAARKGKLGLLLSSVEATYIMQYPEVLENYIKTKWKIVDNMGEDAKLDEKHDILPDGTYEIVFLTDKNDELIQAQDAVILIVDHYHKQLHSTRPQVEEVLEGELIP